MTWPWKGSASVNGTQLTPLCGTISGSSRGSTSSSRHVPDVAQPDGEDRLRLVVEVPAQRGRPDAGGPQQLRRAQRVGGHHHEPGPHDVLGAGLQVAHPHPGGAAVLDQHLGDQRLGDEGEVRVGPGDLAEDDVGAGPGDPAVGLPLHRQRHRADPPVLGPAVVERVAEPLAHLGGERGVVEGVRVDVRAAALPRPAARRGRGGSRSARCRPGAGRRRSSARPCRRRWSTSPRRAARPHRAAASRRPAGTCRAGPAGAPSAA